MNQTRNREKHHRPPALRQPGRARCAQGLRATGEVKLQTSPTIDLGLIRPDSTGALDIPQINGVQIRHCDVRYAIFYAENESTTIRLTHFFLTTGEAFFTRFTQFQGRVVNNKLQILLPRTFFDGDTEGLPS